MSLTTYSKAKKIIEDNNELLDSFEGANKKLIEKAEAVLNVTFPNDYKQFLLDFGAITFGSTEIYGIFTEDFEKSGVPDAVWATLNERKLVNMPDNLVVIYNTEMGELYCLNFNNLNHNNEPRVTSYFAGFDEDAQENEVLYDDFGEFLLDILKEEIE